MPDFTEIWKKIILGSQKSWVAFENGTCVILMQPEDDLAGQAKRILAEQGPVHAATASADMQIVQLKSAPGWVVGCHHPDILNYVGPEQFSGESPSDLAVGVLGRSYRDQDAKSLKVIHVEDKRTQQQK